MNLTREATTELRKAISLCKTIGVDAVALVDGLISGLNDKKNLCIISELKLGLDADTKLGIGRVSELDKRFSLFNDTAAVELKANTKGEISVLTIGAGRSKAQFRCTSLALMRYPKQNDDPASVVITITKEEVASIVKALRTFGAEDFVMKVDAVGSVLIEFSDKTNDLFSTVLEKSAEFTGDPSAQLFTYPADNIATVIDAGGRDADEVTLVLGEGGSITIILKGHSVVLLPKNDEE